ncbi:Pumilio family RNA-binding protein [Entamoeba marina]
MNVTTHSIISLLLDDGEYFSPEDLSTFCESIEESIESVQPQSDECFGVRRSNSACANSDFISPFVSSEESSFSFLTTFHSYQPSPNITRSVVVPQVPSNRVQELISSPPSYQKKVVSSKFKAHTVTDLCKDQQGSRKIQQFIENATEEEVDEIFSFVYSDSLDLMTDLFGNYVVQKLLEHGTKKHAELFLEKIKGNVVRLSLHMYGCRVIQKVLEVIPLKHIKSIANEIRSNVSTFIEDQNGNHVIQKFIDSMSDDDSLFIVHEIKNKVVGYSKHPYGCRVIQRLIERNNADMLEVISNELTQHVWGLSINQYGNYVIQHLIQHGTNEQRETIVQEMKGKLFEYSMKKYSSNVVEKCIRCCGKKERNVFIDELCKNDSNSKKIYDMMCDPYANYVIQRLVEVMTEAQKELFIAKFITPNIEALRCNSYSKHLLQRISTALI